MIDTNKKIIIICGAVGLLIIAVSAFFYFYFGTLEVITNYADAKIFINDELRSQGKFTARFKGGNYRIRVERENMASQERDVQVRGGRKTTENIRLQLKIYSEAEWAKLTPEQKQAYEALSDARADNDEAYLRENNKLINYIPYLDPNYRFNIEYGGTVFEPIYYVTLYGYTDKEINDNKNNFFDWVRSKEVNPSNLKIEFESKLLSGDRNYSE